MPEASECVKKELADGTSLTKDFLVQWQAKLGSSNGCLKVSAPLYLVPKSIKFDLKMKIQTNCGSICKQK